MRILIAFMTLMVGLSSFGQKSNKLYSLPIPNQLAKSITEFSKKHLGGY